MRSDKRTGDRGGAGAAVGLDHIAIQRNRALTEQLQIEYRAHGAANQALDFLGAPALLAFGGFAVAAGVSGARQHAVFRSHPTLAATALVRRHALFHRGGAQDFGAAKSDQHRAFGMRGVGAGDGDRAQCVRGAVESGSNSHQGTQFIKKIIQTGPPARAQPVGQRCRAKR